MEGVATCTNMSTSLTDPARTSNKRLASDISDSENMTHDAIDTLGDTLLSGDTPDGVHPSLWEMLKSIKRDINRETDRVDSIDERVLIIEDQLDHDGTDIAKLKSDVNGVLACNKSLIGRLIRAEKCIARQQEEITELKMRSMRDNIIIRTRGAEYKGHRDENTDATVKAFLQKELRIADAQSINISRSHRMGQESQNNNKMLIAKLPQQDDHKKIFSNASALKGTPYSISKQVPAEIDERRQFAWADFKKARTDRKAAYFDGSRLIVGGDAVSKYEPAPLPTTSAALQGIAAKDMTFGASLAVVESDHVFQACAFKVNDVQDVREALDSFLSETDHAVATHAPYAYRCRSPNGQFIENFESDGDINVGLQCLKILRENNADNMAVYIAHHTSEQRLSMKAKIKCLHQAVSGALLALSNS